MADTKASPSAANAVDDPVVTSLFRSLDPENKGFITRDVFVKHLNSVGLSKEDGRLQFVYNRLRRFKKKDAIGLGDFTHIITPSLSLVQRVLQGDLIIPKWGEFRARVEEIFEHCNTLSDGKVADYIPQLARVNGDQFGMSICTVDGQVLHLGDSDVDFSLQSVCKPLMYLSALIDHGMDKVHQYVGREPSGGRANALSLNSANQPHNPLINSGAIMISSLLQPHLPMAQRFASMLSLWKRFSGNAHIGYSNTTYLSEKATGDRNRALAYFMHAERSFPPNTDIESALELYFQCCSIETTCQSLAVVGATLANGGVCPTTDKPCCDPNLIRSVMSVMFSCGMYNYSGKFAFDVGLPAKAGISGAIMLVVPNVMGVAIWAPKLDDTGNSRKGIAFCKELSKQFNFHVYDSVAPDTSKRMDPTKGNTKRQIVQLTELLFACAQGDIMGIRRALARNVAIDGADYDRRTALHLAASEGQLAAVKILLANGASLAAMDRWGNTPLDDAKRGKYADVVKFMESWKSPSNKK